MPDTVEARRLAIADALRAVALEARVDAMSVQLSDVQSRLGAVETTLLESAWERPAAVVEDAAPEDERVAVPKLALDAGRMSSTAARALFGH